jgi:threonine dehydratase
MKEISGLIADRGANIHTVRHDRSVEDLDVGEAYLIFTVETSGAEHAKSILESIESAGYVVDSVNQGL